MPIDDARHSYFRHYLHKFTSNFRILLLNDLTPISSFSFAFFMSSFADPLKLVSTLILVICIHERDDPFAAMENARKKRKKEKKEKV